MRDKLQELTGLMERDAGFRSRMEELNAAPKATYADFIVLAAEYGIALTESDFTNPAPSAELSDDELDAVAGGHGIVCFCIAAGGGDGGGQACACVLGGGGTTPDSCVCVIGGSGSN